MGGDPHQLSLFENQQLEMFEGNEVKPINEIEDDLKE